MHFKYIISSYLILINSEELFANKCCNDLFTQKLNELKAKVIGFRETLRRQRATLLIQDISPERLAGGAANRPNRVRIY